MGAFDKYRLKSTKSVIDKHMSKIHKLEKIKSMSNLRPALSKGDEIKQQKYQKKLLGIFARNL